MKRASVLLVSCLIATGLARPAVFLGYQDSLGQYSFGYSAPGSARSEVRTSNGATRGTYSYVDETGAIQTAQYIADGENGFRVIATNLPQAPLPVQDTPEVMAARTAHLQAVEMAMRRDEVGARGHEPESPRILQERKLVVDRDNANREQVEIKSARNELRALGPKGAPDNRDEPAYDESDETLQAIASGSGVGKENGKSSQEIRQESAGRATQETTRDASIPAIPSISSHVLLPQTLGQHVVPVFRVTYGNHEIVPSAIPESSIAQGASGVITPAGTALRSGAILAKEAAEYKGGQTPSVNEPSETVGGLIAPVSLIPLSSSSFVRYISPVSLGYVTYNIL